MRKPAVMVFLTLAAPAGLAAQVATAAPATVPTCAAGQVLYPAPVAAGAANNSMMAGVAGAVVPAAGVSMIDAAKKKFLKRDSSMAGAVAAGAAAGAATGAVQAIAGTPQYLCGTPDEATRSMQAQSAAVQAAQAGQSGMPSVGSVLSATPQGMMVNGAIAAAPVVGAAAKKFGGMLFKGQTKESMAADLAKGRLVLKNVKFVEGTDMFVPDAENEFPLLAEALHVVEGQFSLSVPTETDGKSPPDFELAKRRVARIAVYLLTSGITDDHVTARPVSVPSPDSKPATVKPGAARPELNRVPKVSKP